MDLTWTESLEKIPAHFNVSRQSESSSQKWSDDPDMLVFRRFSPDYAHAWARLPCDEANGTRSKSELQFDLTALTPADAKAAWELSWIN